MCGSAHLSIHKRLDEIRTADIVAPRHGIGSDPFLGSVWKNQPETGGGQRLETDHYQHACQPDQEDFQKEIMFMLILHSCDKHGMQEEVLKHEQDHLQPFQCQTPGRALGEWF
jgi:hypothetical protein